MSTSAPTPAAPGRQPTAAGLRALIRRLAAGPDGTTSHAVALAARTITAEQAHKILSSEPYARKLACVIDRGSVHGNVRRCFATPQARDAWATRRAAADAACAEIGGQQPAAAPSNGGMPSPHNPFPQQSKLPTLQG